MQGAVGTFFQRLRFAACKGGLAVLIGSLVIFSLFGQSPSPVPSAAPAEMRLQMILVHTQDEATRILDRLTKGGDFSQLAKEKSVDRTSDDGGLLGNVRVNDLRVELRTAVQGLKPGQITPVVAIRSGFAILRRMTAAESQPRLALSQPAFSVAAAGGIKYIQAVDGFGEADGALNSMPKDPNWNRDPQAVCAARTQSLEVVKAGISARLTGTGQPLAGVQVLHAHFALAQLYVYDGDMDPALEHYLEAYKLAVANYPDLIPQMEETLGIAYLHRSEMRNGAFSAPGKLDLFPMMRDAAFHDPADSKKAVEYFLKYLERTPDELEVKWLLNIAYMTMGQYPSDVPAKYLIPPSAFESKEDVGRFIDVAAAIGVKAFSSAGGAIAEDFRNSGLLDIVTSAVDSCGPMHYFRNEGNGTFTDRTKEAGLSGELGVLNLIQGDYNNDGCTDILALRGGWQFPQRRSLLKNNCDGTFSDVTMASGLGAEVTSSQATVWTDINNDGFLDLFAGSESGRSQLFLNQGDGTFRDIAVAAGVAGDGTPFTKGVAAGDFDGDGYPDLYISTLNGKNALYRNNHDNTFTDVTARAGTPGPAKGFATWFFDYDNDGLLDLFVTSYFVSVEETARTYLNLPLNASTLKLYRNRGDGTFDDVTTQTGLAKAFMPMGSNFGDIDNDGYPDIYLGTGNPSYGALIPAIMLRNHDGKYFVDVTTSAGVGQLHKGHGVAFADLGNNGNEDIVAEVGGATPGDRHALRVFRNPGHDNDWLTLQLTGVKTNRSAIGAHIKVTVETQDGRTRSVYRTVGSGGSFGASPLQQHVGLGKIAKIVSVEVTWPVSRTRQVFSSVAKNQFIGIKELDTTYVKLARKSFSLAGGQ